MLFRAFFAIHDKIYSTVALSLDDVYRDNVTGAYAHLIETLEIGQVYKVNDGLMVIRFQ